METSRAGRSLPAILPRTGVAHPLPSPLPRAGGAPAAITTFSTGYQTPWDITFMPDGRSALVTQRLDYQVFRLGPDGRKKRVGEVPNTVPEPYDDGPGGLLGVAPSPTWDGKKD